MSLRRQCWLLCSAVCACACAMLLLTGLALAASRHGQKDLILTYGEVHLFALGSSGGSALPGPDSMVGTWPLHAQLRGGMYILVLWGLWRHILQACPASPGARPARCQATRERSTYDRPMTSGQRRGRESVGTRRFVIAVAEEQNPIPRSSHVAYRCNLCGEDYTM